MSALDKSPGVKSTIMRVLGDTSLGTASASVQIGGALTASASHSSGQSDTVTVLGNWSAGNHAVTVTFLNDAWGGSAATDRNLYVDAATYNGAAVSGAAQAINSDWQPGSFGFLDPLV